MERYFLNIRHRDGLVIDEEGSLHADLTAAYDCAVAGARELLGADIQRGLADLDQSIMILDDIGTVLAEVEFSTVLTIIGFDKANLRECIKSYGRAPVTPLNVDVIAALDGVTVGAEIEAAP
jgi:hypothetical protein